MIPGSQRLILPPIDIFVEGQLCLIEWLTENKKLERLPRLADTVANGKTPT